MTDPTLGVWTDGTDTVIAYDKLDVEIVIREHAGSFESNIDDFFRRDDDYVLSILDEEPPDYTARKITLTCREWIAKNGRGFLGSTEY